MKEKIYEIIDSLQSQLGLEDTFEMANLKAWRSGLRYDVWLDSNGSERKNKHNNPRVKVKVPDRRGYIPIVLYPDGHAEVDKHAKDFRYSNEFIKWVEDNAEIIRSHFVEEIDDLEVLQRLSKK